MAGTPRPPSRESAKRLLLALFSTVVIIFVLDSLAHVLVSRLPPLPVWVLSLIDATLLAIPAFPALYFLVIAPLARHAARRDRAERALAESEAHLRQAEEKYRSIFEHAPHGIYQMTPGGAFLTANTAMARILGCSAEELTTQLANVASQSCADPDRRVEFLRRVERTGAVHDLEFEVLRKDGSRRWVSETARVVRNAEGVVQYFEGTLTDITDRKQAIDEVRRSEARYRAVTESAGAAIITVDGLGNIVGWNPAAESMFGYTAAEITGQPSTRLMPHRYHERHLAGLDRVRSGGESHLLFGKTVELEGLRKDQSEFPLELSLTHWETSEGWFVTGIVRDITQRRQTEEALRRSHDLLDQTGQVAKVGGWELDRETQTLRWTHEVYRIHEKDPGSQPSLAEAIQFYAPEARPLIAAAVQAAVDEGTPFDLELPLITARGRHIWARVQGTAERREGETVRLFGAFQDITERKHAQDAEGRLAAILEATPDLVAIADPKGQLVYTNRAGRAMVGLDEQADVTRYNIRQFHDAASAHVVLTEGVPTAVQDGAWTGETELLALDGHSIAVSQVIVAHRNPDGTVAFVSTIARDIAERTRAQRALQDSERLLKETQSIAGLGSYVLDVSEGRWTSSAILDDVFGIDDQFDRTVDAWVRLIHPEWRERMSRYLTDEVLGQHRRFDMEYPVIRKSDGHERWVHGLGELEFDAHGNPARMIGTINDITAKREAETALRLQAAALYAAADAIVITDRAGVIEWVNPAFTEITGYTAEEALGRNPRDLVKSDKHTAAFYKDFWETILAGRTWHGEMINRRKDGNLYTEDQSVTPILDASGAITHFVAIKADISERLQLEAQFRQAQKMESVGQLASGIAHDFNNLLTIINGTAVLMLDQITDDDPIHADVQEIAHAGERAASLTRQLLAFSRQQILAPRVLNFNAVVAGMEGLLRRLLGEDIDLAVAPAPDLGNVNADPGQIEQVIANLAVNARDAMPKGGKLTIETRNIVIDDDYARQHRVAVVPGPYAQLVVSDSGVGMDEATRTRIFEPFFTTKGKGKGTGLGLSTVFGIVKQSHGFIWVDSEAGHGTSFTISLPQVTEAASTDRPEPTARSSSGTETVLLVDDSDGLCKLATRVLEPAGYTVLAAATGEEALHLLEGYEAPVHLLLTDVVLPALGGRELAERLVLTRPEMKVLYMSGYTSDTVIRHGVFEGNVAFLHKPFTAVALLQKVRDVLNSPA